ncbi:hypothetical protein [Marivivens niveibacter]|uniref:hypothetical protein n=1 Tax=Marivivens niveibacter TaxID=1930667 RepID=UPI00105589B1|nr:hypothetical protein [Marivivens niveibacter]
MTKQSKPMRYEFGRRRKFPAENNARFIALPLPLTTHSKQADQQGELKLRTKKAPENLMQTHHAGVF